MPVIDTGEGKPSPSQIDAARRILAHPAKRTYGKGSVGTTVRAIKVYLKWKGYDPGPLNGHWDTQAQKAFSKARGADRATPAALREISKDFGKPGPRPRRISPTLASMRPIMPGAMDQGGDVLRDALSGVPPASGVGPQPGMMDTEEAGAVARTADRQIGDLAGPDVMPPPDAGGVPFGPGGGASDPLQQGYGNATPLEPKNSDFIPPLPPGGAIPTPPGGPGAVSGGGQMDFPPSALTPDQPPPPPSPPVMPSPAEGGMPFGPGNAAQDPLQQQLTPPPNWPPDPNAPPSGLGEFQSPVGGAPPPPPQAMPTPPPPDQGGLTAADLVPPNDTGGSPIPQALGSVPDSTQTGDLGALPGAPQAPPDATASGDLGALPGAPPSAGPPPLPPTDEDTALAGDLGTLAPAVRSPDTEVPGWMPAATKPGMDEGYNLPSKDIPTPPMRPELGDLTGSTPPTGGGSTRTIKKGDTLWAIAEQEYGDPRLWPMIAKANPGIKNPNLIYYGKKLNIPAL